jgi:hypothetical protein
MLIFNAGQAKILIFPEKRENRVEKLQAPEQDRGLVGQERKIPLDRTKSQIESCKPGPYSYINLLVGTETPYLCTLSASLLLALTSCLAAVSRKLTAEADINYLCPLQAAAWH